MFLFGMKCVIVLKEEMPSGLMCNAVACMVSGLFNGEPEALGEPIQGNDFELIPITKIPILITKQGKNSFSDLLRRAKKNKLRYMLFTREGQSTTNYDEYRERTAGKTIEEIEPIGIGVIGPKNLVNSFAGDLALLR